MGLGLCRLCCPGGALAVSASCEANRGTAGSEPLLWAARRRGTRKPPPRGRGGAGPTGPACSSASPSATRRLRPNLTWEDPTGRYRVWSPNLTPRPSTSQRNFDLPLGLSACCPRRYGRLICLYFQEPT